PFPFLSAYAELDCISNFTFLTGASHPEELVERAARLGYEALALCDDCSLAGVVRAHQEALRQNLHLIIGSRFHLQEGMEILALACNTNGYGNLSETITLARRRSAKGEYRLSLNDLSHPPAGLEHLRGLPDCLIIFKPDNDPDPARLDEHLRRLREVFPRKLWIGVALHYGPSDSRHLATLEQAGKQHGLALVALGGVEMHQRSRQPLHDALTAIRHGRSVPEVIEHLHPNAERHLRGRLRLANLYPPPLLQETLRIREHCRFSLEQATRLYRYPKEIVPQGLTP